MRIQITTPHTQAALAPAPFAAGEIVAVLHEDTEFPGWHRFRARDAREAWIHSAFLRMEGDQAVLSIDYSSVELSVTAGSEGEVIESLIGWPWARMADSRVVWLSAVVAALA